MDSINDKSKDNPQSSQPDIDQFFSNFNASKVSREVSIRSFLATASRLRSEIESEALLDGSHKLYSRDEGSVNSSKVGDINSSDMPKSSSLLFDSPSYNDDENKDVLESTYGVQRKKIFTVHKDQKYSKDILASRIGSKENDLDEDFASLRDEDSNKNSNEETVKQTDKKLKLRQNPKKNLPGLVLQRVNKSCFEYINRDKKKLKIRKGRQIEYIGCILREYSQEVVQELASFTKSYDRNCKTWVAVEKFLMSNKQLGNILLRVSEAFLSNIGRMDFDDWIEGGKMKEKGRKEAIESKAWLLKSFRDLIARMQ